MHNHFPATSRNLSGTVTSSENSYLPRRKRAARELTRDRTRDSLDAVEIAKSTDSGRSLAIDRVAALRNIAFATKLFPLATRIATSATSKGSGNAGDRKEIQSRKHA